MACMHKRTRDCFSASDCRRAPSQASTAAAAATCSDGAAAAAVRHTALTLCCGVNRRCAIDVGVRNVVRNIVAMFCGVVSEAAIADVCAMMVQQGAGMRSVYLEPTDDDDEEVEKDEEMSSYFEGVSDSVVAVIVATREVLEQIMHHLPAMVCPPPHLPSPRILASGAVLLYFHWMTG